VDLGGLFAAASDSGALHAGRIAKQTSPRRNLVSYEGCIAGLQRGGGRMSMEDRVVMISGATGGLGQVAAKEFAKRGARLVLASTSREKLGDLAADVGQPDERILTHAVKLDEPTAARFVVDAAIQKFGRVDVLLHLVGGWSGGKGVADLDTKEIDSMLRQHLWTTVHLAQAVIPSMRAARWGRIMVISSPTASQPVAKRAPYAIGKAAQEALVLTLAQELKGSGVTANLVLVQTIDTNRERQRKPATSNANWTTPEEITATLLHLCAEEAAMINGARIPLYGG
jgi:NAD(P)-dependent dehydrogenase (short-subunit alcohol dehydrogenase family)